MRDLPALTLLQMLREQARRQPDRIAVRQKELGIWRAITWADYEARARHVGLGLRALGLSRGGHVAVLSDNRVEWVLAQLGAGMVGSPTVGVYATSPSNEVAFVLEHADVEVVVCEDQEQADKVLERLDALPMLRRIVVVETKGLRHYPRDRVAAFAEVEASGRALAGTAADDVDVIVSAQTAADIGLLVYTSGSTGKPKGALLSYRNLRAEALAVIERLGLDEDTTHLSYLPLCHVAEQMLTTMAPIYAGFLVNFGESIRTVQEDLREVAPTMFLGVPRIWEKLHSLIHIKMIETGRLRRRLFEAAFAACEPFAEKAPSQRSPRERLIHALAYWSVFRALQNYIGLRRARVVMTGAAPIPGKIVRFFRTLGLPLVEVYGATETSGLATGQRPDERRPGCVGSAGLGIELRLGEAGELLVRGDTVFEGYYKNDEATRAALRDGWYHTGDVAELDGDQVRIVDRLKDVLITAGGKNLSPSEIENTVKGSPYIRECIVIGEARKYVSALIQVDAESVGKWAETQGLAYTGFRSLAESEAVRGLIQAEIEAANSQLAPVAHVRRFHLLTKELDHDDDEVTATMKVRRGSIQKRYAAEIDGLYA